MSKPLSLTLFGPLVLAFLGCAPTESELFTETQAALAEGSGLSCAEDRNFTIGTSEVDIDDSPGVCENSLSCVAVGEDAASLLGVDPTDGLCTCRCDGPPGSGPYCSCLEGFTCVQLIEDIGLGTGDLSYCMPD